MPDLSTFATLPPWHIVSYGTLLGSEIFQSFIGGPIAFKVLPRPSFATLQSGIFPVYFSMQTALPAILALTYPGNLRTGTGISGVLHEQNKWSVLTPLATIFVTSLANLTWIGPATTKTMRERKHQGMLTLTYKTRDGKKAYDPAPHSAEMQRLNKKFGMLHGVSSLLNLAAVLATIWYGGTLAELMK